MPPPFFLAMAGVQGVGDAGVRARLHGRFGKMHVAPCTLALVRVYRESFMLSQTRTRVDGGVDMLGMAKAVQQSHTRPDPLGCVPPFCYAFCPFDAFCPFVLQEKFQAYLSLADSFFAASVKQGSTDVNQVVRTGSCGAARCVGLRLFIPGTPGHSKRQGFSSEEDAQFSITSR